MMIRSREVWPIVRNLLNVDPKRRIRKFAITLDRDEEILVDTEEFVTNEDGLSAEITRKRCCIKILDGKYQLADIEQAYAKRTEDTPTTPHAAQDSEAAKQIRA